MTATGKLLWSPSPERIRASRIHDYMQWLARERNVHCADYNALWQWSVDHLSEFWASMWDYFEVQASTPYSRVLDAEKMPGAKWFEGARLNVAQQVFRFHTAEEEADRPAIISRSELRPLQQMSWRELRRQVASAAQALRDMGVQPGDRVVAYLPNVPETVVAFLACASVGAIWSSCSPDMGTPSVVDRFGQIAPKVLIAADGYRYGGKDFDRREVVQQLRGSLPTLDHVVLFQYLKPGVPLDGIVAWDSLLQNEVIAVAEIPRTLTGKKMELPVKKLLLGMPVAEVANPDAMANPQSLNFYVELARQRNGN